jgi:peroxiredoxin
MTSRIVSPTLRVGDMAPPIALPGLDGDIVELAEARGICGVLLLFAPGAWSPATRRQLGEINAVYEQFKTNGIQVVVLMTQNAGPLQDRLAGYAIPFPILADAHREAARDYGVYRAVAWDGIGVTRPAVFMISRDGEIRFMYVGDGESDQPDTETLLRLAIWLIGVAPVEDEVPPSETVIALPGHVEPVLVAEGELSDDDIADLVALEVAAASTTPAESEAAEEAEPELQPTAAEPVRESDEVEAPTVELTAVGNGAHPEPLILNGHELEGNENGHLADEEEQLTAAIPADRKATERPGS